MQTGPPIAFLSTSAPLTRQKRTSRVHGMNLRGTTLAFRLAGLVLVAGCSTPTESPLDRSNGALSNEADIRVVMQRPSCEKIASTRKAGAHWEVDTPFPLAPAGVRRALCSYHWITTTPKDPESPRYDELLLSKDEEKLLSRAILHCELGECLAPEISPKRIRRAGPVLLGGGGGCPSCGFVVGSTVFAIFPYARDNVPYRILRVGMPRANDSHVVEIDLPMNVAFSVKLDALDTAALAEAERQWPRPICIVPIYDPQHPPLHCP